MIKKILFLLLGVFSLSVFSSCDEETESVSGCTDSEACNYNSAATTSDGSCNFICLTDAEKTRVSDFVETAIDYIDANGSAAAYTAFEDTTGAFIKDELYIFVWDSLGNVLSHGVQASLIGTNIYNLQDNHGKYFVKELLDISQNDGEGWGWYYWDHPLIHTVEKKFTFVKTHNSLIVAAGTYK